MNRGTLRIGGFCLGLCLILLSVCVAVGSAGAPRLAPAHRASGPANLLPKARDSCWSEPPDLNGFIGSSEQIPSYGVESEIANDFVPEGNIINHVFFWGAAFNNDTPCQSGIPTPGLNLRFYEDSDCAPGSIIADIHVGLGEFTEESVGCQSDQFPLFKWGASVNIPTLAGNRYWFGGQVSDHEFPPEFGRLAAGGITGCESMFKSEFFGFPDWTPCIDVFGLAFDASQEFECGELQLGACCFADHHCEPLGELNCRSHGGAWQGPDTLCEPNPCASIAAACCLPDGHCEVLSQAACDEAEGSPVMSWTCDPNPCPMACCFLDGRCEYIGESACRSAGGNPLGAPSNCDPNVCPQYGACCNPATGSCTVEPEGRCIAPDVWMGGGTACDPNPCSQPPTGACCNPATGSCAVRTQADCRYDWQGEGTTCTPNPCPQPPGVSVYYVRADGGVPSSPPYFPTIQAAIDYENLQSGDAIELIGTPFTGVENRDVDFHGKRVTVRSQGGDPDQCVIDCQGAGRGFVFQSGEDNRSVLEAVTITRGGSVISAGGISISNSSPWIRGCRITSCSTVWDFPGSGGGIGIGGNSSPLLTDCTIDHCTAGSSRYYGNGGGLCSSAGSYVTMMNCVVASNYAEHYSAYDAYGGGVWCCSGSFSNCIISSNEASSGGGVFCESGNLSISNCEIRGNNGGAGGAVEAGGAAVVTMEHCVITGNWGESGGIAGANCTITNCTIAGNVGTGISSMGAFQVSRTILWGNCPWDGRGSGMSFTCCDVNPAKLSGDYTLNGPQVETDPIFCAPEPCESAPTVAGDYRLNGLSPCLPHVRPCSALIGALDLGCYPAGLEDLVVGEATGLMRGCPNPFVDETAIVFSLAKEAVVDLAIYDVGGRCVRRLASQTPYTAGVQQLIWQGRDDAGRPLPAGVYVCRLRVGGEITTSRLVVLK